MKSIKDRAIDILWEMIGKEFSREIVISMAADKSPNGESLRKSLRAIERGIEADRREAQAMRAPS